MIGAVTISVKGIDKVIKSLKTFGPRVQEEAQMIVKDSADDMVREAIKRAPADEGAAGGIRSAINKEAVGANYKVAMQKTHGIYQEFGTKGKFRTPTFLGSYPSRFRGKGTGSYKDALKSMEGWVRRKGVTGRFSVKTKRRLGSKTSQEQENKQAAYLILRKILREGLKPQPYFFPAFLVVRKRMIAQMKQLLKEEIRKR